jgi:hypothetical protein
MGYLQKMLSFIQLMNNSLNMGFEEVCGDVVQSIKFIIK